MAERHGRSPHGKLLAPTGLTVRRGGYVAATLVSMPNPGGDMFAIIAAVLFAVVLVLDLADKPDALGAVLSTEFLVNAGLLCIALHLAGAGSRLRGYRGRRPGPG